MNYRIPTLLTVCAALAALAACEPKPQPPKAAVSQEGLVTVGHAGTSTEVQTGINGLTASTI